MKTFRISLKDWMRLVSSSGTFIKAAVMEDLPGGDSDIPVGWTVKNYGEE